MKTQVNVSNRIHADYLEGDVPGYIWKVINKNFLFLSLTLVYVADTDLSPPHVLIACWT